MSWLKLKAAVMDAVCRRKLATPGEYSFVSKYVLLHFSRHSCIYFQYTPFCVTPSLCSKGLPERMLWKGGNVGPAKA